MGRSHNSFSSTLECKPVSHHELDPYSPAYPLPTLSKWTPQSTPRTGRYLLANTLTHTVMAGHFPLLPPRVRHRLGHPAPTNDRPSSSKFRAGVPRSSMPLWLTRPVSLSTPSRATRAARNCARRGTTARSPPSTGTVPVRAWFFVGRRPRSKSGCHVLGLTPSTCSC
jgi:hypothetical protein